MGTTLDNGTYLPDEGERNCYEGLAGNWVALDNHLGSTNIHVTINDKQTWNGHVADTTIHVTSADKQAWDGHVADSVKHVTAEDKAKWDAVTTKANDTDVLHKTGDETSTGFKQFDNIRLNNSIRAISLDNQTVNLDNCYSTFTPSGSTGNGNIQYYCCNTNGATVNISNLPEKVSFFLESVTFRVVTGVAHVKQTLYCYGNKTYVRYYNGATWTPWNNIHDELTTSSVSLPNLSAGVDISGYLTNAGTTTPSEYTPTVDGWIVIAISADSPAFIRVFSSGGIDTTAYAERNEIGSTSGGTYTRYAALTVPCRQNDKQNIVIMPSTMGIVKAKFYPCMGNA